MVRRAAVFGLPAAAAVVIHALYGGLLAPRFREGWQGPSWWAGAFVLAMVLSFMVAGALASSWRERAVAVGLACGAEFFANLVSTGAHALQVKADDTEFWLTRSAVALVASASCVSLGALLRLVTRD